MSDHFPVELQFKKPEIVIPNRNTNVDTELLIGSFNIENLGPTKLGRPEFVSTVLKIFIKYDILMIQEIRDSSYNNEIFQTLIDALNAFAE